MLTLKYLSSKLLEIAFILLAMLWILDTAASGVFNYPLSALLAVLLLQLFIGSRLLGVMLGLILLLGAFYMELAVLSDFIQFPEKNDKAWTLLIVGSAIFGSAMIAAVLMMRKNILVK
jgi:uncharacterized membrane protein YedE/YeeE